MLTVLSVVLGATCLAAAFLVLSRRRRSIRNLRGPPSDFMFGMTVYNYLYPGPFDLSFRKCPPIWVPKECGRS